MIFINYCRKYVITYLVAFWRVLLASHKEGSDQWKLCLISILFCTIQSNNSAKFLRISATGKTSEWPRRSFDLLFSNLSIAASLPTYNSSPPTTTLSPAPPIKTAKLLQTLCSSFTCLPHRSVPQHPTCPTQTSLYLFHLLKISPELQQQNTIDGGT